MYRCFWPLDSRNSGSFFRRSRKKRNTNALLLWLFVNIVNYKKSLNIILFG